MTRRLAVALLALLVAQTGVAVCARGVQACSALRAATPECCTNGSLAASDCCCPAKGAQAATSLPASELAKTPVLNPLLVVLPVTVAPMPPTRLSALASQHPRRALAPPDTLLSRHTSLLL
jgi:hypothetical protein